MSRQALYRRWRSSGSCWSAARGRELRRPAAGTLRRWHRSPRRFGLAGQLAAMILAQGLAVAAVAARRRVAARVAVARPRRRAGRGRPARARRLRPRAGQRAPHLPGAHRRHPQLPRRRLQPAPGRHARGRAGRPGRPLQRDGRRPARRSATTSTSASCCSTPCSRARPWPSCWPAPPAASPTRTAPRASCSRGGRRLEGQACPSVLAGLPARDPRDPHPARRRALHRARRGRGGDLPRRAPHLPAQHAEPHACYVVERLTPELRRQEVEVWKKAIRVMNHELNNSLAPIRSLVHSARHGGGAPGARAPAGGDLRHPRGARDLPLGVPRGLRALRAPPAPAQAAGGLAASSSTACGA